MSEEQPSIIDLVAGMRQMRRDGSLARFEHMLIQLELAIAEMAIDVGGPTGEEQRRDLLACAGRIEAAAMNVKLVAG